MSTDGELPLVRRSGKSESAFRTISEVADELDVPQHVLRFWESKFPQVKPLKRGGGRRYYRPEDVALLRRIRDLLYSEGYTIKGVQKLLREGGHKDAAGGASKSDSEPQLPMGDDDQPDTAEAAEADDADETDDVDEEGDDEPIPVDEPEEDTPESEPAPVEGGRLSAETRRELAALLEELEQLRGLLHPR